MRIISISFFVFLFLIRFGRTQRDRKLIWDGPCGVRELTIAERMVLWPKMWNIPEHLGQIVYPYILPYSDNVDDLLVLNPWLVTLATYKDLEPLGVASLIRVRPSANWTDIAVTSCTVCETIMKYRPRAVFGARDRLRHLIEIPVEDCVPHPNCGSTDAADFNIGLVKLKWPIPLTGPIQAICVPPNKDVSISAPGVNGFVLGHKNLRLRRLNMQIIDQAECSLERSDYFCAHGGQNVGFGDVGGPFITQVNGQSMLTGIVESYPSRNSASFAPTPIVRFSTYAKPKKWIERTIWKTSILWIYKQDD